MENFEPSKLHNILFSNIVPKLRWNGIDDIDSLKEESRLKLIELLGIGNIKKAENDDFRIVEKSSIGKNNYIHFIFQSEENYYVNAHLLYPSKGDKFKLCIGMQGHVSGAHISLDIGKFKNDDNYIRNEGCNFSIQAVSHGYCGLAIEQRCFGENGGNKEHGYTNCTHSTMTALLMGRTTIAERVFDIQRTIDIIEKYFSDLVSLDDSILMGQSGGGTATFYTACLEDRIKVFVPSGAVCTFQDSIVEIEHCPCNYIPSLGNYFDMGDLGILIAPKKLIVAHGRYDRIFPIDGVIKTFNRIKTFYDYLGKSDNCALVIGERDHVFYPNETWEAIEKMI